jgi:RNA polymerase sigma-70 factor (ECF subfamily)
MRATVIALVEARSMANCVWQTAVREAIIATARPTSPKNAAAEKTDEVLMRSYQRGDDEAFRQLYQRHRAALYRFVRRQSSNGADAQEVAQETWMAVIQGRTRYRPEARFVTYLFSIARRRTIDRWRKLARSVGLDARSDELDELEGHSPQDPEFYTDTIALRAGLMSAVELLPILQREAFLLHAEGTLTLEEIGQVTGTSRETAKSRLRYALNRLRIALEPWHEK